MTISGATPRSILLIFAHPDDESFAAAGLSRRYADEGAEIALVTATRGEAGKRGDPPVCTAEELPARREAELRQAAAILGVRHVQILDYHDQHLAEAPPDKIREELVAALRSHRPHVVLTFDPNGVNGHVDHIAIGRFATDAIAAAADGRWYPSRGEAHCVRRVLWTPPILPWDVPEAGDLSRVPGVDFVLDISRYCRAKAAALKAHRTQHLSIDRSFFNRPNVDQILGLELFRQASARRPEKIPADDIFDGLEI
jgi:LmbE family N-acetylglucosaminyl deacetylase